MSSSPSSPETPIEGANVAAESAQNAQKNVLMSSWQVGLLVAVSVTLNTLLSTFPGVKSAYLLKDVLHLSASQVSTFALITGIPAYLRPFMGTGADLFPFLGFHRKSYYLLSWLVYAAGQLTMAAIATHDYAVDQVILLSIVTATGANLLFVIMDSVMVAIGNQTGTIGRLQAVQQGLPLIYGLAFSSWLTGYCAQHWTYQQCFLASGSVAVLGAFTTLLIHERPVDRRYERLPYTLHERHVEHVQDKVDFRIHAASLVKALSSPGLWISVVFVFYLILTPGLGAAQFYYEVNILHFSPQFIGDLGRPGSAGAIIGTAMFLLVGRKLPTAAIVWGAFLGDLCSYPMLFFLKGHMSAEVITLLGAIIGQLYNLCLLTFAAKACPKGVEASIYALFVGSISLAGNFSNQIGSSIYDYYGPAHHHSVQYGWNMALWVGIVLTAVAALMIPLLPRWARDPKFERETLAAASA